MPYFIWMQTAFEHRPRTSFGQTRLSWLDSRHHFSFGDYFNPQRHRFGVLRVVNDDTVTAGEGFDMHSHRDMEIITYVTRGAVHHRDSLGNHGITRAGSLQVMSAGTGIAHAEFADPATDTHFFQIWITPARTGLPPHWAQTDLLATDISGMPALLASGFADDLQNPHILPVRQDIRLFRIAQTANKGIEIPFPCSGYAIITDGQLTIDQTIFKTGDAIAVPDPTILSGQAGPEGVNVLALDLPRISR